MGFMIEESGVKLTSSAEINNLWNYTSIPLMYSWHDGETHGQLSLSCGKIRLFPSFFWESAEDHVSLIWNKVTSCK
jgi:hypothetical protein